MPPSRSFYIIDGHAQIYRAYFAPFRNLTGPGGEPTKATFVFTQMLLNLIDQRKPDYLAMVIDSGDESVFRKQIYPEYKSTREPPPDDFFPQEKRILDIVRDTGVPIFVKPGMEADDLIATMAHELGQEDFQVFLVSKDKDLRQALTPRVHMYDPASDEVIDAKKLEEKVGYLPRQAIEVQTLMGDAIDNVPGIPGVGEKTAARLIQKYGAADAVLDHLDELTPKMRENFQQFGDRLKMSRQLVTLKTDVDFDFSVEACRFAGLNQEALKRHLRECGFTSLLKRIEDDASAPITEPKTSAPQKPVALKAPSFDEGLFGSSTRVGISAKPQAEGGIGPYTSEDCVYECVDTDGKFQKFLKQLKKQKRFAFDTETVSLGAVRYPVIGMSFSWKENTGYYLPIKGPSDCKILDAASTIAAIKPILEDPKIKKVGHNLKYDLLAMRQAGVHVRGVSMDSMIAAFLIDASRLRYGIDQLALDLLNFRKIETVELIGKGKNQITMDHVPLDHISRYASEDADIALRLCDLLEKKLDELPAIRKLADEVEIPLIDVLVEMEHNGLAVDPAILRQQSEVIGQRIDALRAQIIRAAGCEFNPDSPKQLAEVLFNRLGLRAVKKTKTGLSTDVEVLDKLADEHPVPRLMLEYRALVKLKNTYLDNLTQFIDPATGRIHGSFSQIGAETGRLSMSDPNLQNIPIRSDEGRRIRLAFVPGDRENNVLLTADYSQIELRVLAHFTREPALLQAFGDDEDIHRTVASQVFAVSLKDVTREQRDQAKTINFGIIYGVTPQGLARRIEGLSIRQAADFIAAYNRRFPAIGQFMDKCVMEASTQGYVETILGRRRPIPDIHSRVGSVAQMAKRQAINSVVQGSAADLIKIAMRNIYARLQKENRPSRMLLQVHDELVFETPRKSVESEADMVREEMTSAMQLAVPLKVEVGWGKNWQEVK